MAPKGVLPLILASIYLIWYKGFYRDDNWKLKMERWVFQCRNNLRYLSFYFLEYMSQFGLGKYNLHSILRVNEFCPSFLYLWRNFLLLFHLSDVIEHFLYTRRA